MFFRILGNQLKHISNEANDLVSLLERETGSVSEITENGDEEIERAISLEKLFRTPEGYPPINSLEDLITQAIDIAHKYDFRSGEVGRAAAHIARRFDLKKIN